MRHNSHRIHFQTKQISFGERDESEWTSGEVICPHTKYPIGVDSY